MRTLRLFLSVLTVSGLLALPAAPASAALDPQARTAGQSTYVPTAPVRLLDTREDGGRLGAAQTRDLVVAGRTGVPATATAVVLSVTVLGGQASTDVKVYPPPTEPGASSLVVARGGSASNLVTVALGPQGQVRMRNAAGQVHLIADLAGYFHDAPGATYVPAASPDRLLDTREGSAATGSGAQSSGAQGSGALGDAEVRTLRVAGVGAVPAGASAVVVNLTAVGATRSTDVRAYPSGLATPPNASNSNPGPGRPTAVAAVVAVGDNGAIDLRNSAGTVHLVVDLQGWYVPGDAHGTFHPLPPRRLLDTRVTGPALGAGATRDVTVAGVVAPDAAGASVTVPAQATAVALTVTAVGATTGSDVRVYPAPVDGSTVPPSSTLNVARGTLVANAALPAVGRDGAVRLRNAAGSVHLVVDVVGWYGPTGRGWDVSWPQCTTRGATTSRLPDGGGAFAVVGLTRGVPFTDNECFATQWSWASSLRGEPAVYLNTNAPGSASPQWRSPGPRACSGGDKDSGCAFNYGRALAAYAIERMPTTPSRGRPFVWFDVENGPVWQTGEGATAVNRNVINGAAQRLRESGYRYGLYVDRASAGTNNDWVQIMGAWSLPHLSTWVFRAQGADPRPQCAPSESISGGPVAMVQSQPATTGEAFDVNDLC